MINNQELCVVSIRGCRNTPDNRGDDREEEFALEGDLRGVSRDIFGHLSRSLLSYTPSLSLLRLAGLSRSGLSLSFPFLFVKK